MKRLQIKMWECPEHFHILLKPITTSPIIEYLFTEEIILSKN